MKQLIEIYDTTLRDGTQAEDIHLSTEDKIKIALKLDALGVRYIEGGWPGSNPVDKAFFNEIAGQTFAHACITAFGSTHHPNFVAAEDPNLRAIIESGVRAASIFGKSWTIHVKEALRVPMERNLELVYDSVAYLRCHLAEVFFDAEHFFDGYKENPTYALAVLRKAHEAGARILVLCDTNGGTMPHEVTTIVTAVRKDLPYAVVGIHAHNDCELAVANSIAAVQAGATHVQGTINGFGERCGNANLCSVIPILEKKLADSYACLPQGNLPLLSAIAHFTSEVANVQPFNRQPFVGRSAFAHKGGIHASAVSRMSDLYEHMSPETVGNEQRILLTELAGRSNIISLARRFGFHLDKDEPVVKGLLKELKAKASLGYDYAAAEASIELLLLRKLARKGVRHFFRLINFRVLESKQGWDEQPMSEATVIVEVEGVEEHTAASGKGPVNALDNALRKALSEFYPRLSEMRLLDFKVRVLNSSSGHGKGGTASVVRVLIESGDQNSRWVTVGVSFNIIEASWQALVDSITYKLYKDECAQRNSLHSK